MSLRSGSVNCFAGLPGSGRIDSHLARITYRPFKVFVRVGILAGALAISADVFVICHFVPAFRRE